MARTGATHTFIATQRLSIFVLGNIAEAMQVPFPEFRYLALMPHDKGPSVLPIRSWMDSPRVCELPGWVLFLRTGITNIALVRQ